MAVYAVHMYVHICMGVAVAFLPFKMRLNYGRQFCYNLIRYGVRYWLRLVDPGGESEGSPNLFHGIKKDVTRQESHHRNPNNFTHILVF